MNVNATASSTDFPMIGTLIMMAVFVYAWIADTSERKEAFANHMGPPSRIETFYNPPQVQKVNRAYAEGDE
jgi:hypothetical protein